MEIFTIFLLLSLFILKYMHDFLMLQTLKLNNERLTPGVNPTKLHFSLFSDFPVKLSQIVIQKNNAIAIKWPSLKANSGKKCPFYIEKMFGRIDSYFLFFPENMLCTHNTHTFTKRLTVM
jgi:hypothetical protein